jgi:Lar family restriction alleviation protein
MTEPVQSCSADSLELKSCPFCGGKGAITLGVTLRETQTVDVICQDCGGTMPAFDKAEAKADWNRRITAPAQPLPEPSEALKLADEMQSLGYAEFGDCLSFNAYNLILAALRAAQPPAIAQPALTQEDVYANCWTTLIGFSEELTERDCKFICDQVARKVILAAQPPAAPVEIPGFTIDALRKQAFRMHPADQFKLACFIAENVGYVLAPEKDHPDSPHNGSSADTGDKPVKVVSDAAQFRGIADIIESDPEWFSYEIDDDVLVRALRLAADYASIPNEPQEVGMREAALEAAARDFIAKVDRGEARSKNSYAAFKSALALSRPHLSCGEDK